MKAMLETQRQAAIAPPQQTHAASGTAEDSIHREARQAKGRVVQLMLAKGEPGGNAWMRWVGWRAMSLCHEPGVGSGAVIGYLHHADLEAPRCGA